MVKLAVFDLDGTLLDSSDALRPETAQALNDLYRSGVKLMICSGRAPSMARAYFRQADVRGFLCCAGGAYIEDEDGTVIHSQPLPPDILRRLMAELRQTDVKFSLMTHDNVHTGPDGTGISVRFRRYQALAEQYGLPYGRLLNDRDEIDLDIVPVYKIPVIEFDPSRIPRRMEQLAPFADLVEITPSGASVIDLTVKGNSKGQAVAFVTRLLALPKEAVCCMGDYDNDIPMFRRAGLSVAMGNAPEHVQSAADHITGSNDANGAAEAIYRYLLPGKKPQ